MIIIFEHKSQLAVAIIKMADLRHVQIWYCIKPVSIIADYGQKYLSVQPNFYITNVGKKAGLLNLKYRTQVSYKYPFISES